MPEKQSDGVCELRNDIVVSVCFSDLPDSEASFAKLRAVARELDAVYRFREIILVVEDAKHDKYLGLVHEVPDVRLFVTQPGTGHYDRRVIAAEEAIGDVVLIGSAEEIGYLDVVALVQQAERSNAIVQAVVATHRTTRAGLHSPLALLGRLAGFNVKLSNLQTIAMPRAMLNLLLGHSEPQLALRFPPRDPRLKVVDHTISSRVGPGAVLRRFPRRMQLLQKLLVYLAPSLLVLVAIASTVLTCLGIGFAIYVVAVWMVVDDLASGWLTTSAMLSVSAVFIGLSILGLSLGLQHIFAQTVRSGRTRVPEEINQIDLFSKVVSDLNVELESGPESASPSPN